MSLLSNAKWNTFSQIFKILVQLINVVYLAKIIPPAEYGLMAMALVVINLGMLLRDLGTSSALIKQKKLTDSLINTVFWLNTIMGVGLAILVCTAAPLISSFYNQERLVSILLSMSIIFPLSSCASAHMALMQRESLFKKISFIEVSSSFISLLIALAFAKLGYGVYSLIFQAISLNALSAILFWTLSKWKPNCKSLIVRKDIKEIFSFTKNVSIFNFVNYFSRNADSFIIGKAMSSVILGSYNLAYRIMLFPIQNLTYIATRSLYPVLSQYQDDNIRISNIYMRCTYFILFVSAPLMMGLAILSKPFIFFVFGPQWYITGDVLKWLAPTGILQSILSTTGAVFMAKNRTDLLLRLGLLGAILQVGAFLIGAKYNIDIFVKLYFISNLINFFPAMYLVFNILDSSLLLFFKKITPILLSVLFMSLGILYFENLIKLSTSFNDFLALIVIGSVIYLSSMAILSSELRSFFIKRKHR